MTLPQVGGSPPGHSFHGELRSCVRLTGVSRSELARHRSVVEERLDGEDAQGRTVRPFDTNPELPTIRHFGWRLRTVVARLVPNPVGRLVEGRRGRRRTLTILPPYRQHASFSIPMVGRLAASLTPWREKHVLRPHKRLSV